TRTARGHTARPLRADRFDTACYVLVLLAAVVRVAVPLLAPAQTLHAVLGSALLWSAGFGLYAIRYWPALSRPLPDGLPGRTSAAGTRALHDLKRGRVDAAQPVTACA